MRASDNSFEDPMSAIEGTVPYQEYLPYPEKKRKPREIMKRKMKKIAVDDAIIYNLKVKLKSLTTARQNRVDGRSDAASTSRSTIKFL